MQYISGLLNYADQMRLKLFTNSGGSGEMLLDPSECALSTMLTVRKG